MFHFCACQVSRSSFTRNYLLVISINVSNRTSFLGARRGERGGQGQFLLHTSINEEFRKIFTRTRILKHPFNKY